MATHSTCRPCGDVARTSLYTQLCPTCKGYRCSGSSSSAKPLTFPDTPHSSSARTLVMIPQLAVLDVRMRSALPSLRLCLPSVSRLYYQPNSCKCDSEARLTIAYANIRLAPLDQFDRHCVQLVEVVARVGDLPRLKAQPADCV